MLGQTSTNFRPAPNADLTFVRIPGTLCDARVWQSMQWPASWRMRDADVSDSHDLGKLAGKLVESCQGRLVPVGFSMGGMVALEMARQAPDRIAGLVLIGTNFREDNPVKRAARESQIARLPTVGLGRIVREELLPGYFGKSIDPTVEQTVMAMAMSAGADAARKQYAALASRPDQTNTLLEYAGPLLIIAGEEDRVCAPSGQQDMARLARLADFHSLPGIGHMVPLEAPDEVMRIMQNWASARIEGMSCPIVS